MFEIELKDLISLRPIQTTTAPPSTPQEAFLEAFYALNNARQAIDKAEAAATKAEQLANEQNEKNRKYIYFFYFFYIY